jgi:ABC-type uncharacterized transport system permease subunit
MSLNQFFDANLLNSLPRYITPVFLAALGSVVCSQAGVMNIALEGLMLIGAFFGVWFSYILQSATAGVIFAVLGSTFVAFIFGLFAIKLKGNLIVMGIALNLFCSGITVYLLRTIFNTRGAFQDPAIVGLKTFQLKFIENIPFLGPLLSGHTILIYLSIILWIITTILLYRHSVGLRLRGIGELPSAAQALGVNVSLYQFGSVIFSGILCGLSGAQLSLGNVKLFVENMSAGRGWVAVAAVMLSQGNPISVFIACIVFGFSDAIGGRLQTIGVPVEFTQALPYLVTIISLLFIYLRKKRSDSLFEI